MTHLSVFTATAFALLFLVVAVSSPLSAETPCDAKMMQGSIAQLSATRATVNTSVLVDADPGEVWATLTDFDAISGWSSGTLQGTIRDIKDGGSVTIAFIFGTTEDGEPNVMTISHGLIQDEGSVIGRSVPFPADIGGGHDNHLYGVEAWGDQTLFDQTDEIVDTPYAANFVAQSLPTYQAFNAELKAEVEGQSCAFCGARLCEWSERHKWPKLTFIQSPKLGRECSLHISEAMRHFGIWCFNQRQAVALAGDGGSDCSEAIAYRSGTLRTRHSVALIQSDIELLRRNVALKPKKRPHEKTHSDPNRRFSGLTAIRSGINLHVTDISSLRQFDRTKKYLEIVLCDIEPPAPEPGPAPS